MKYINVWCGLWEIYRAADECKGCEYIQECRNLKLKVPVEFEFESCQHPGAKCEDCLERIGCPHRK